MCLVMSILLAALGINFYLNGFYIQAGLMAPASLIFLVFMIKNIGCAKNGCNMKLKDNKEEK